MRRFTAVGRNTPFRCQVCGHEVPPLEGGGCRNHCPRCLHSLHVDLFPGDRANPCKGVLEPIGALPDARKGWVIVHRCRRCGELRRNRAAVEGESEPDDFEALLELSRHGVPER